MKLYVGLYDTGHINVSGDPLDRENVLATCTPLVDMTESEQLNAILFFGELFGHIDSVSVMSFGTLCGEFADQFMMEQEALE